mmetsp:Transcript_22429/g.39369  ORF Transcript_22429/g.39369 Transcript_22429/m.39369 type:complete len:212 (-) Transcript_22429:141-776(-)
MLTTGRSGLRHHIACRSVKACQGKRVTIHREAGFQPPSVQTSKRRVVVLRSVMHDELVLHKVEAVRSSFPGRAPQRLFPFLGEQRLRVNHLPSVPAVRHDKGHGEVIACDELISKIMPLDHSEVAHLVVTVGEFKRGAYGLNVQKLRSKVIPNEAAGLTPIWRHWGRSVSGTEIKKNPFVALVEGPDPEIHEVKVVDVVLQVTQVSVRGSS